MRGSNNSSSSRNNSWRRSGTSRHSRSPGRHSPLPRVLAEGRLLRHPQQHQVCRPRATSPPSDRAPPPPCTLASTSPPVDASTLEKPRPTFAAAASAARNLHPTPCTLHPAPCTLHPTPCALHPTPYTLHPTPCTLHHTPYTLYPTLHSRLLHSRRSKSLLRQRLVFYCRTTSASTAPCTSRRMCCPTHCASYSARVSRSCEHFPDGFDRHLLPSLEAGSDHVGLLDTCDSGVHRKPPPSWALLVRLPCQPLSSDMHSSI